MAEITSMAQSMYLQKKKVFNEIKLRTTLRSYSTKH